MKCDSCDNETLNEIPDLGYPCFHCFLIHASDGVNYTITSKLLRDPEINWWIQDVPRKWRRAAIDHQELLEQAFQIHVHNLISS